MRVCLLLPLTLIRSFYGHKTLNITFAEGSYRALIRIKAGYHPLVLMPVFQAALLTAPDELHFPLYRNKLCFAACVGAAVRVFCSDAFNLAVAQVADNFPRQFSVLPGLPAPAVRQLMFQCIKTLF